MNKKDSVNIVKLYQNSNLRKVGVPLRAKKSMKCPNEI